MKEIKCWLNTLKRFIKNKYLEKIIYGSMILIARYENDYEQYD